MKVFLKNERGFSIVEMVVVIAIMGILGSTLMGLTQTSSSLYRVSNEEMRAQEEARVTLEWITSEIRRNDRYHGVEVDLPNNTIKIYRENGFELTISRNGNEMQYLYHHDEDGNGTFEDSIDNFTTGGYINDFQIVSVTPSSITDTGFVESVEVSISYTLPSGGGDTMTTLIELRSDQD